MSKVPVIKDRRLTIAESLPQDITEGILLKASGDYLPQLDFVYPIMITPDKPHLKNYGFHFGFSNGDKFEKLTDDTILTVVHTRNMVKFVEDMDFGNQRNWYSKLTVGEKVYDGTDEEFHQELKSAQMGTPGYSWGHSTVLVALFPDGKAVVLEFSKTKTVDSYIYNLLLPAVITKRVGFKMGITDHTPNLIKSKRGMYYPKASKYQQWEHVQLSREQLQSALGALEKARPGYENWLNR